MVVVVFSTLLYVRVLFSLCWPDSSLSCQRYFIEHGTWDAARAAGMSVLIYTSSSSVSIRRVRLWLWPWEKQPPLSVRTIDDDDDSRLPRRHEEMFSNYAASKLKVEKLIRAADRTHYHHPEEEWPAASYGVSATGDRDLRHRGRHSVRRVSCPAGQSPVGPRYPLEFHLRRERLARTFLLRTASH
jgi:hypothetical protein